MKIRYVQLESDAFLTDIDFMNFSPAERGVYCSLIFYLTSNKGKCRFDPQALGRLCGCQTPAEFEAIWEKVGGKFQLRNEFIRHKRVTRELSRARRIHQTKSRAGLSGAVKRWHSYGTAIPDAIAKESEGNVNEKISENAPNTNTDEQAHSSSTSPGGRPDRAVDFTEALAGIIEPKSRSDRTCFANVGRWLVAGCRSGRFDGEIFDRVLGLAREARQGKNPAGLFMTMLKKELGYVAVSS